MAAVDVLAVLYDRAAKSHDDHEFDVAADAVYGLIGAANRVTAAFRAHGEAKRTADLLTTRRECEAAMLAMDAALKAVTP